jgi:HK97 family phage major capsid protein
MELESKAFGHDNGLEVKKAFEDFLAGFEAFKQGNDERLKGLEKRGGDVLLDEKVSRINQALENQQRHLDGLMLEAARPALGGERKLSDPRSIERKHAFDAYVRSGATAGLFEVKAMSEGSNSDGGYTVPLEIERTIDRVLAKASPIRSIATVRQIGGGTYRKPIVTAGAASGWTGETDAISSPTNTPTLAALDFPAMELYAMPAATQTLLDDSQVDIEQWLAEEVQTVFAEQEGAAFVNGTGSGQPKGFLHYTNVADASWSWGNLGYVKSGADGAFLADASAPADALLDLAYAPKQAYRAN